MPKVLVHPLVFHQRLDQNLGVSGSPQRIGTLVAALSAEKTHDILRVE